MKDLKLFQHNVHCGQPEPNQSKSSLDTEEIKSIIFSRGRIENQRGLLDKRNLVGRRSIPFLDTNQPSFQSLPDFLQEPCLESDIEMLNSVPK